MLLYFVLYLHYKFHFLPMPIGGLITFPRNLKSSYHPGSPQVSVFGFTSALNAVMLLYYTALTRVRLLVTGFEPHQPTPIATSPKVQHAPFCCSGSPFMPLIAPWFSFNQLGFKWLSLVKLFLCLKIISVALQAFFLTTLLPSLMPLIPRPLTQTSI